LFPQLGHFVKDKDAPQLLQNYPIKIGIGILEKRDDLKRDLMDRSGIEPEASTMPR
jgi:hypothetical protein